MKPMMSRALLLGLVLAGCAPQGDGGVTETSQDLVTCPECESNRTNAQGVVNIEGGNSCVYTFDSGLICPLAFNSVNGAVTVSVRAEDNSFSWTRPVSASVGLLPVTLTGISASETWPVVTYVGAGGRAVSASGSALSNITLTFTLAGDTIQLKLGSGTEAPHAVSGIYEVNLRARVNGSAWQYLCTDDEGAEEPGSLYGGAFFDPTTAQRTNNAGTVMVSCKKGGITTCLEWGYKPWQIAYNPTVPGFQSLAEAHVACIQMKRAAYRGGASWTRNHTPFELDDVYGIQSTPPANLEAVWTSQGAVCLNPGNLRHPELHFELSSGPAIPVCGNDPMPWFDGVWGAKTADGTFPQP